MVRVSSPAKLRPWSELTATMVIGVVPGLVTQVQILLLVGPPAHDFLAIIVHDKDGLPMRH